MSGRRAMREAVPTSAVPSEPSIADVVAEIAAGLETRGYAYVPNFQSENDAGKRLLAVARCFGELLVADGKPLLHTETNASAPEWEPFNRPERIGWHNDFSTWPERPELSLAWVAEGPPFDAPRGDWRAVTCGDVIAQLDLSAGGREVLALFEHEEFPFCFAPDERVQRFRVLPDSRATGRARFYGRAMRLGLELAETPTPMESAALDAWEGAAEKVGTTCAAERGALLVCDNWRAMHDRLEQSNGRRTILCFVRERAAITASG